MNPPQDNSSSSSPMKATNFSVFDRANKSEIKERKEELKSRFQIFLDRDSSIPGFPIAVARVQTLISKGNVDFKEVADVILLDPSLAAKITSLANSVVYGGGDIARLDLAIQRIGLAQLKGVIIICGAATALKDFKVNANWGHFWLHSILVARMTEKVYGCFARVTGDEYIAGLMHDTGKLFLQKVFPAEYREVLELVKNNRLSSEQAEFTVFGFSHADVSAELCQRWGMPGSVTTAVKFHHDPSFPDLSSKESCLATCLNVADSLANSCNLQLIEGQKVLKENDIYRMPGWIKLADYKQIKELAVDVKDELAEVEAITHALI
ncbi:MAG: HDOD domain-containing protein [Verrucomicrobiota bacterium]